MNTVLPLVAGAAALLAAQPAARAAGEPPASPNYIRATAYHIPPETTTEESGYFALCEGKDGKVYVGCAAYGRNSYLVDFAPKTEQMGVVLDVHKLVGLPLTPTGYAAQSKIHTRCFVGPSGRSTSGPSRAIPPQRKRKRFSAPRRSLSIAAGTSWSTTRRRIARRTS